MTNEEITSGLWKHTCRGVKCGNIWTSYKEFPKNCPKCKSPYWNVPYTKKGYVDDENKNET